MPTSRTHDGYKDYRPHTPMLPHFVGPDAMDLGLPPPLPRYVARKQVCVSGVVWGWPEPHIHTYIRCMYGIVSRGFTVHTVIYGVHIQFRPTLLLLYLGKM